MRELMKLGTVAPLLIGLVLMLSSCASTKSATQSVSAGDPEDAVSLVVLSEKDVRAQYGRTFMENPFVAPSASVFPTYNDYIVVKLNFNTSEKAPMTLLRAEVADERGKIFAASMTREKFAEFAMNQSPEQANNTLKRNNINWYYLPNPSMTVPAGKHSYLVILVGRHPIPDAATIHIDVSVGDQDKTFDIPVPISNE